MVVCTRLNKRCSSHTFHLLQIWTSKTFSVSFTPYFVLILSKEILSQFSTLIIHMPNYERTIFSPKGSMAVFRLKSSMPFKLDLGLQNIPHLSQNNPSNRNPKLNMKTSVEVLSIICLPQEPSSVGHCHYK